MFTISVLFFLHIESELIDPRKPSRFGNFSFFGEAFRLIKDLEEISVTQRPQEMPLHFYSAPCFFSFLLLHDVSYRWKLWLYVALANEGERESIKDGEGWGAKQKDDPLLHTAHI